jgi:putative radical SAM enzyme (TIGR03279 family)
MPSARVVAVAPGSPAALAGVVAGDEILAVNGEAIRDVIQYQIQADDAEVELELRRGGLERVVAVSKDAGAPLGLELASAVFDRVRTCDNHCPFCFIHQLPPGMRRSLSLKDDDYRLSFLYGNFTTLTRFTEADLERVVTEALSPLYVSIHATDPDVRTTLLRNRRGATSLRWLEALLDHGIEVHGQVVVCPGLNDGAVLDDTMLGILDRFPTISTVGVVPLGVSDFNTEPEMRAHTPEEALAVVEAIEGWQEVFTAVLGHRLVYLGDEYHLMAGRPFPPLEAYEGCLQHENGIGMAATFTAEVRAALAGESVEGTGPRSGFFAWVDGAPAEGFRAPRVTGVLPVRDARRRGAPVALLTGAYGRAVLEPLLPELTDRAGAPVRCLEVENRWFGGNIGVTGLMTGPDIARTLADVQPGERVLLPDVALSEDRFLDGSTVADLPHPVEVVATTGVALVEALT